MARFFFFGKLIFWLLWAGVAVCLCWGPWFSQEDVSKVPTYWKLMNAWTVMTAGVLFYVIFCSRTALSELLHEQEGLTNRAHIDFMNRRVITLSLIGGFAVALPAFALAFISLIVAVPHINAGLSGGETSYLLEDSVPVASDHRSSAYFVAVDISASNIPGPQDPKVDEVCGLVQTLLSSDRDGRRIVKTEDDFRPFVFDGGRESLFYSEDANFNKDALSSRFCQELRERLKEKREDKERTDIVAFLDYIYGWIDLKSREHEHITLIMLSDFIQDKPVEDNERIESAIATFMANIRQKKCVHIVGFSMPASGNKDQGVSVLPYLEKYGMGQEAGGRIWREIPLEHYLKREVDGQRAMLLANVYREIRHQRPLYLKYEVAPTSQGVQASLQMPDNSNYRLVYVVVRPSRDGSDALSKLSINFGDSTDPFDLGFGGLGLPEFGAYRRQGVPLPIKLNSELDISRSVECDLLIAVPTLATVHSVRLVIVPVVGNIATDALQLALRFLSVAVVLFALGASGIQEVIHSWWAKRRGHKHAIPT